MQDNEELKKVLKQLEIDVSAMIKKNVNEYTELKDICERIKKIEELINAG